VLTPRNLIRHLSHFQVEHALFPHLSPMAHNLSTISCPTFSAFVMKSSSKYCKILSTIAPIVLARTLLRMCSTHLIVRSTIALSTLDSALNHTLVLKALDLILARSCLVVKENYLSSPIARVSQLEMRSSIVYMRSVLLKVNSQAL